MLDWPSIDGYTDSRHVFDNARDYRAWFFISFQQLPVVEQERALPWLREIVFDEFVPEYSELPLSFEESDERRWFIRILSFGEKALIALFGEQGAKDVTKLGIRGRDRYYEMNERQQDRDERLNAIDDRLRSIDEQLACLLGPDRTNRNDQFDRENALDHLLDQMLNAQEKTSVYVFHGASYPICSEYCELLWDRVVSTILLEQKITIVESPYEQWRWLEFMRKLSVTRLRSQHPGWRFGWRW